MLSISLLRIQSNNLSLKMDTIFDRITLSIESSLSNKYKK